VTAKQAYAKEKLRQHRIRQAIALVNRAETLLMEAGEMYSCSQLGSWLVNDAPGVRDGEEVPQCDETK
jgi:hypothetical protein